ncbi:MAG: polysaccharide biosynthesis C-terminal domain-containing protein [Oscillospiraceae bacterium]|nr:polysaccharide biosynthesis C-terminal domain-containing protein [Oscillospiraceae bacterium]
MNKYKTLAMNTVVFAIGNIGAKLISFLLTRLYTANLDRAEFNTKDILEMCANFLIPVVSFSITDAIIRYGLDKNYEKRAVFSNAIAVLIAGSAGFIILSPLLLLFTDIRPYAVLLVGYIIVSCFRQISTQFARARGFVKLYAVDGIGCMLTLLVYNLVFMSWLHLGITGFLLAVMLSDLTSGVFVWWIAGHGRYFRRKYIDRELLQVMLRFSMPLIPTALLWIITGFSDRLFLRFMKSAEDGGLYSAASKIPNLISMVSTVFYQAWNMSAIAENDSKERSTFYTTVYDAYQAMLFLAAGFIIAFDIPLSWVLIDTTKDPGYALAYLYTPVLVIAVLMMCLNQFLSSIYTVTKHTQNSFWTSLAAALLNLILNAVLIPKFGINGAISATFFSYVICYLIRIVDTQRLIRFRVEHFKTLVNLALLYLMCTVVQDPLLGEASFSYFGHKLFAAVKLIILLAAIAAFNIKPLLATARKLLRRRSKS